MKQPCYSLGKGRVARVRWLVLIALCGFAAAALPDALSAAPDSAPAPNCALTVIGRQQHLDINHYRGKVLYVDFWASWCGPCQKSFPFLNEMKRDFQSKGLEIVGLNMDENLADAQAFMVRHPPDFTVVTPASDQCARDFGVQGMPSSYLIDRNGRIRHVQIGFRPGEAAQLRALVKQLLTETTAAQ